MSAPIRISAIMITATRNCLVANVGVGCASPSLFDSVVLFGSSSILFIKQSLGSGWSWDNTLSWRQPIRLALFKLRHRSLQDTEHHWNKEQCGDGGHEQAANHRPAQRRILLAAFAQSQSHRH